MASAYWERRNAKARELGYQNYYDYRAHGYGATPPSAPKASGERLRRLRGHAGPADLERAASSGRRPVLALVEPEGRDAKGRWTSARVRLQLDDGTEQEFWLRGATLKRGPEIADLIRDAGGRVFDPYGLMGETPEAERAVAA